MNAFTAGIVAAAALSLVITILTLALRGARFAAIRHRLISISAAVALLLPLSAPLLPARVESTPAPVSAPAPPPVVVEASDNTPAPRVETSTSSLPIAWIAVAGSILVLAWRLRSFVALAMLMRRAHKSTMIDSPVTVLLSDAVTIPMTYGFLWPVIALPADAEQWDDERREAVLQHELAHIRRRDLVAVWILVATSAAYWWNPLIWWLERCARADAEIAADALAVASGMRPSTYALQLLESARRLAFPSGVALPMNGGALEERVDALLESRAKGTVSPRVSRTIAISTAMAGLLLASPLLPKEAKTPAPPDVVRSVTTMLDDRDPMVRRSAVNTLRDLSAANVPAVKQDLRTKLDDRDEDVRRAAEVALGLRAPKKNLEFKRSRRRMPEPGEIAALIAALADPSKHARQAAAGSLGDLADPAAVPALIQALSDPSDHVRQVAAGSLGQIGSIAALDALIEVTRDPNEHVRQVAAGSLGQIGSIAALDALIEATRDPDEHVRQAAVDAVGDLGDPRGVSALVAALEDPNPFVRAGALNSIVEIHGQ